jgi:protein SCO1/2
MNRPATSCAQEAASLRRARARLSLPFPIGLLAAVLLAGCDGGTPSKTRTFETRGVVREIAADQTKAVIRHEEIPGYMPKMTMELIVRRPVELRGISVGDEITFRLHATEETHWIDTIRRVGRGPQESPPLTPFLKPKYAKELKPGDEMPDAEFLSEAGQPMRLKDFRGRALAFTFFFTRCPLPDYCPRMNKCFREARDLLLARPLAPTNWTFLCVSFDADFDKPAVLRSQGNFYRGTNTTGWLFASATPEVLSEFAPAIDLMVMREGESFSHNLRTVVLDPQGRIFKQFDGNTWTPAQLADAVAQAAVVAPQGR